MGHSIFCAPKECMGGGSGLVFVGRAQGTRREYIGRTRAGSITCADQKCSSLGYFCPLLNSEVLKATTKVSIDGSPKFPIMRL